jgi:acrylyl-CoA reductase (NADPH)
MPVADTFKALVLNEEEGGVRAEVDDAKFADLPDGDVLIRVAYSSLNYKDGLAVTGKGKVVRRYPMVPGIDLAGTVEESQSPVWEPGDRVTLTGFGTSETHWGGYAQLARAKSDWLVRLPDGLSLFQSMALGTAGLTAMLSVMALEEHGLEPGQGEVVVSGASGGVGSLGVAILANLGYDVVASTGRAQLRSFLEGLGAKDIIDRDVLSAPSTRPLESARWSGAVDTVGGDILAGILRALSNHASVAACGNAGGVALNTTVLPFILRGVNLLGIDSNYCPLDRRRIAWERLALEFPLDKLDRIVSNTASLEDVPRLSEEILMGQVQGRIVVDVQG